jgi:hypothetical protein
MAFTLATYSVQMQHTRSLNLNMITVKVGALQQDIVSECLRRWTRNPLGSAHRRLNSLAVVFSAGIIARDNRLCWRRSS